MSKEFEVVCGELQAHLQGEGQNLHLMIGLFVRRDFLIDTRKVRNMLAFRGSLRAPLVDAQRCRLLLLGVVGREAADDSFTRPLLEATKRASIGPWSCPVQTENISRIVFQTAFFIRIKELLLKVRFELLL